MPIPQIVSIILVVLLFFVIGSAHYLFTQIWNLGDVKQVLNATRNDLIGPADKPEDRLVELIEPVLENPEGVIDTVIISGPDNNETITDSDSVTFKYRARVYSENAAQNITFETKISGIDSDWKESRSNSRTIELRPGFKKYTFYVRAKSGAYIDSTPAKRTFSSDLPF